MKRTKKILSNTSMPNGLEIVNSVLLSRLNLASQLGLSYSGNRDLYKALGYKKVLYPIDYYNEYIRGDIAKTINNKLPDSCWVNRPNVKDGSKETEQSSFETSYKVLAKKFKFYTVLNRLDKLVGLGQYGVLLIGLNDSIDLAQPVQPNTKKELKYLQPYGSVSATIDTYDINPKSERYGLPVTYNIVTPDFYKNNTTSEIQSKTTMKVHYTRVIHIVEDPLESEVISSPRLEPIFNRLQDIQKILGGSAEMFWRNASPGRVAKAEKDTTLGPQDRSDLIEQFDEYDHNLRRWLRVQGIDIKELTSNIESPKDALSVQLDIISIVTGIPKRILIGSERGELASTQDEKAFNTLVYNRMLNFCEPNVLRPLIDRLIEYKILPPPEKNEYDISWPKMSIIGEKEKATIALEKMKAFGEYLKSPGATDALPLEIFMRDILQFPHEVIKEITEKIGDLDLEEYQEIPNSHEEVIEE